MIKPKLSLQRFQQNIRIQKQISNKLGYHLQNQCYSPKQKSNQSSSTSKQKIYIRQNINPLQVSQKQQKHSKRLQQLNKQIQQMQIQKKINLMTNSQQKSNMNIIQLLNKKIREYNYIVEHKHIIDRDRNKVKSSFQKIGKKQDSELSTQRQVLERIKIKQKDLNKTGSLMAKFKRNQQLSSLYRQYSKSMKLSQRQKIVPYDSSSKNQIKIGSNTTDTRTYAKIKPIAETQAPQTKRYEQQIDIEYPYIQKKSLQGFNQLNSTVKRNRIMSKIMKQKLKKISHHKKDDSFAKNAEQETTQNIAEDPQLKTQLSQFSLQYNNISSNLVRSNIHDINRQQQSYLSLALSKRNPKYIKSQGSKFLIKFDSNSLVKSMLEGLPKKQKQSNKIIQIPKLYNRKLKIPQDLTSQQKTIMQMMIQNQSDSYYWTTCRNQKINLMLKGRKHS